MNVFMIMVCLVLLFTIIFLGMQSLVERNGLFLFFVVLFISMLVALLHFCSPLEVKE